VPKKYLSFALVFFTKKWNSSFQIFRMNDKEDFAPNLSWSSTSREKISGLNPGTSYNLSVIGIGCKENDTQQTVPIKVSTDVFEPAFIQLESSDEIILGKFLLFENLLGCRGDTDLD